MTRKFVYDPLGERVRMVAWTTGSHVTAVARGSRSLRWMMLALVVLASALALDAAHASTSEAEPAASTR